MWDQREEAIGGVDELDVTSGAGLDHLQSLREDAVSALNLLSGHFPERHFLCVDLELDQRLLHGFDIKDHGHQFLNRFIEF